MASMPQEPAVGPAPWDDIMAEVGNQDQRKKPRIDGTVELVEKTRRQANTAASAPTTSPNLQESKQQQHEHAGTASTHGEAAPVQAGAATAQPAANLLMAAAHAQAKQEKKEASIKQLTPEEMRAVAQRQVA